MPEELRYHRERSVSGDLEVLIRNILSVTYEAKPDSRIQKLNPILETQILQANLVVRRTQSASIIHSLFVNFAYHPLSSQAARRDQNRIAQREFRLRKQQRVCRAYLLVDRFWAEYMPYKIRDLEARVEILSGGKDEALGEMRNMLKGLYFMQH